MTKASQLEEAQRLVEKRKELWRAIRSVDRPVDMFGRSIGFGGAPSPLLVPRALSVELHPCSLVIGHDSPLYDGIVALFRERLAEVNAQLAAMGVEIDDTYRLIYGEIEAEPSQKEAVSP